MSMFKDQEAIRKRMEQGELLPWERPYMRWPDSVRVGPRIGLTQQSNNSTPPPQPK